MIGLQVAAVALLSLITAFLLSLVAAAYVLIGYVHDALTLLREIADELRTAPIRPTP